jgi:Coenzyme F420-reducing hydrogenase, beta subunit
MPSIFETVVDGGYCIGCGVCAALTNGIDIRFDEFGRYVAKRTSESVSVDVASVCPFADNVANETDLARERFPDAPSLNPYLGPVVSTYAGWVNEGSYRENGSSGGLATWILTELLRRNIVDHVVHVAPGDTAGGALFEYKISSNEESVRSGAKSRYYPVEMSKVLRQIAETPGRYAVIGVPCFIKGVLLAASESAVFKERIAVTVAIFCGHLKSTAFSKLLAMQCGTAPQDMVSLDFRTKIPNRNANSYGVTITARNDVGLVQSVRPMDSLYGGDWGLGFFKYKACDFCDDVVGETADVSVGDAWLPEYVADSRGTNVVVVRSRLIDKLLRESAQAGRLHLDEISEEKVSSSQAAGFRHRREGLPYRLKLQDDNGQWRPKKRIAAGERHLSPRQRKIYRLRMMLAEESHLAFLCAKDADDFRRILHPLVDGYRELQKIGFFRSLLLLAKRKVAALLRRN